MIFCQDSCFWLLRGSCAPCAVETEGTNAIDSFSGDYGKQFVAITPLARGHFQLTARLWSAVKRAAGARVVAYSSIGHNVAGMDFDDPNFNHRPYDKWVAYGQSKTATSLFAVALDKRAQVHGVRAFAVHPGAVLTDLLRYMSDEELKAWGVYRENGALRASGGFKSIEQGAATAIWCAVSPQLDGKGGVYCEDCDIARMVPADDKGYSGVRPYAVDQDAADALWGLSEKLTHVQFRCDQ